MTLLRQAIETYIHAKDGNRPHLIRHAFTADAELAMKVKTDEISFPSTVKGADGIAAVLVSQFALRYENVYTFCMGMPPRDETAFRCDWLVCMTEKETGAARVGFGAYEWVSRDGAGLVSKLEITIEEMKNLPRESGGVILEWASRLPYPWCAHDLPAESAPAVPALEEIVGRLARSQ